MLDRFYTALRKSGSLRKRGEPLSASRLRDVRAVISDARRGAVIETVILLAEWRGRLNVV